MPRFRPLTPTAVRGEITDLLAVGQLIDDAMQPGHFFAAPELRLTWIAARSETIRWEIFRGCVVDRTQTREKQSFLSWHVIQDRAAEPTISVIPFHPSPGTPGEGRGVRAEHSVADCIALNPDPSPGAPGEGGESVLSVKLDVRNRQIHVTRGLLCHAWEACDTSGGIESRETIRWTRELVGTIMLTEYADLECVRDELVCLLWQAVVGTSRLPLTSVEAPLPAFVFGQLHYLYQSGAGEQACASWEDWLRRGLQTACAWRETVKLVEFVLRNLELDIGAIRRLLGVFDTEWPPLSMSRYERLACALFNDVSLSPVTHFAENALGLGVIWGGLSFLSDLLRKLSRHLTAYDLVTFHHRGANYPDALLLDGVLKHFIPCASLLGSDDRESRLHRRALRQACLMRRHYEGHLVPDAPTSPGENARVMPASHPRVPDEQLTQTHRRRRQLFADEPLAELLAEDARAVLAQSVRDLENLDERVEMGLGLFIDRPLGYGKEIGEPDLTSLLAHEAFSPSLARHRWRDLKKLCAELAVPCDAGALDALFENGPWPLGLPHAELADCPRPTAALADVRKVAADFVILRTLPGGLTELMKSFDWRELTQRFRLAFLAEGPPRLCVQVRDDAGRPVLALFDDDLRRRLEFRVDSEHEFHRRAGIESPRAGLQVLTVWEDVGDGAELRRNDSVGMVVGPALLSVADFLGGRLNHGRVQ